MVDFKIIPFAYCTGQENMTFDESLLEEAILNNSSTFIFRLYGWKPACVSLGRNQKLDFLDLSILKSKNIDVVTRLTGGRALLHDKELTYSVVCPQSLLKQGQSVMASYKEISEVLIDAFKALGLNLSLGGESVHTNHDYCMLVSTGADLNFQGRKLVGSAQCRKKGYILQHGSIPYDLDKALLAKIFNENIDVSTVTTVKEVLPSYTIERFSMEFQDAVKNVLSVRES